MIVHLCFDKEGHVIQAEFEAFEGSEAIELPSNAARPDRFLSAHRRVDGKWLPREPEHWEPPPEEIEAQRQAEEAAAKAADDRARKWAGIEFEGQACSATSADQAGLLAVLTAIQLQTVAFQPTRFEFENGTTLVIHLGNYRAFMAAWLPFRQSFFAVLK